jgi:hypothetical protein
VTGFIGEMEAGADPVDAACTSAEEWDFGGLFGSCGFKRMKTDFRPPFWPLDES